MLQLDRVQDSSHPHTELVTETAPFKQSPLLSAPALIVERPPSAAQPVSSLPKCSESTLSRNGHAAQGHTCNALGIHARGPTTLHGQGANRLQLSTLPTPMSKLASLLQQHHSTHAQQPTTGSNNAGHPLDLSPPGQSSLPASMMHIQPHHLTKHQLQNLQKAAELLQSATPETAERSKITLQHPIRASAAAVAQLSLQQSASGQTQSMHNCAAASPGVNAMECCVTQSLTSVTHEALHDDMVCSSGSHDGPQHDASRLLFGTEDDSDDVVAAVLDGKLASMAPRVSTLYVDTLCTAEPHRHVASLLDNGSSGLLVSRKRDKSTMQLEGAANLPESGALKSCRPDHLLAACVHQGKIVCTAAAKSRQGQQLVQRKSDVQRKRFRKTTGIEVLYHTMPLLCEQLFPSGIPS